MRYLIFAFFIGVSSINAQSIDYNLKKGYVAEGYDVVAYFNNEAIEGDKKYSTTHDGVNYKFSSQNNLDAFLKAPEKYIPQYGGYCAYAIAEKSKKVGINPKTFEIRNGKLYLFYNKWGTNTLELWEKNILKDVKGYVSKADLNWEAIKN
ncbi:YHS domain-containing (seleno)protein [Winogradskyella immobilis]|uniref:YHS domain-containing protein n=1 Tax=Winogradskyella immobilis TaxID=2816852 RepID=A0ABS8EIM4_9FLAO|nr:YHS domain-containing (seleno)protein [Winogradskyella immobilis]MCC1483044.1 YHS domain-containing protein [Winogradskyella immobilis]MCG0015139.1 hypothetical protein [Winogradskyella immobilis]